MSSIPDKPVPASGQPAFQWTRFNRPGQPVLSYRLGTYDTFVEQMLALLATQTVPGGGQPEGTLPLAGLNRDVIQDWAVALLHAWGMAADVLAFYQERIANEGYLRTASESRSVLELVRTVGYEPRPALAASTYLAFTVRSEANMPPRRVLVPKGLAVQSVPAQAHRPQIPQDLLTHRSPADAQLPQTFETSQSFEARPQWNALQPARFFPMGWQDIRPGTTSVRLAGIKTGLRPGDALLIVGERRDDGQDKSQPWLFALVKTVEAKPQAGFTRLLWENGQASHQDQKPFGNPKLFALRQQTTLLGYTQAGLYQIVDQHSRWAPTHIGLPDKAVLCLVMTPEEALFAGTEEGIFRSENHAQSWEPVNTGLTRKHVHALTVTETGSLYAGSDGGSIYRSSDHGQTWTPVSSGRSTPKPKGLSRLWRRTSPALPKTVIRKLLAYTHKKKHYLVAGTDDGVFRSHDRGEGWQPHNLGLPERDAKTGLAKLSVPALATLQNGRHLFAGTEQGVFRLKQGPVFKLLYGMVSGIILGALLFYLPVLTGSLKNSLVIGLVARYTQAFRAITAVMSFKPMFAAAAGISLILLRRLIIRYLDILTRLDLPTRSLIGRESGQVFAGTKYGVFRSEAQGRLWSLIKRWWPVQRWRSVNHGLLNKICELGQTFQPTLENQTISAALHKELDKYNIKLTQDNFVVVESSGNRWLILDKDETPVYFLRKEAEGIAVYQARDIQALAFSPRGELLAGTDQGEVFRSTDNGNHWVDVTGNLTLKDTQALLAARNGTFAAGTPQQAVVERQWSPFQVQDHQVDLTKAFPKISPESWLVLRQKQAPDSALYRVRAVSTVTGQDFKKKSPFTRLEVDTTQELASFDRLTTTAWTQSEQLAFFDDQPVAGKRLTLAEQVPDLSPGQRIIVSGKRPRVRVAAKTTDDLVLTSADGLQQAKLSPGDLLQLLASPDYQASGEVRWRLQTREGFDGHLTAAVDDIILEPAEPEDQTVSELAIILGVENRGETEIILQESLRNIYDRATATIYANVVHATHGQTTGQEVLGSSDGVQVHRLLRLKQGPLTYLVESTAQGIESTLTVSVDGLPWHAVPSLYGADGNERAFSIRRDDQGRTEVIFGDGQHGTRLPRGNEHVSATYRIGSGLAGNVAAGSLSQMRERPAGITKVTNPMAASGGVAPETPNQARRKAPPQVRMLQRIVSLRDFEDFVSAFAGIGRAQARLLWNGRNRLLHITIADTDGQEVSRDSDLYVALIGAINAARATSSPPLHIESFERLAFNLKAGLVIEPDHLPQKSVLQAARNVLVNSFANTQRDFGQNVFASEILALLQNVPGVSAVRLEALHVHGTDVALNQTLEAHVARWQQGAIRPAQRLVINAAGKDGINLEIAL